MSAAVAQETGHRHVTAGRSGRGEFGGDVDETAHHGDLARAAVEAIAQVRVGDAADLLRDARRVHVGPGPAGDLLQMMDRHPYRPSHFHFRVRAPGHQELVTQIFDREDKYVDNDSVFAVKDSLIVDFKPAPAGADTKYVVDYDIRLTAAKAETRATRTAKVVSEAEHGRRAAG